MLVSGPDKPDVRFPDESALLAAFEEINGAEITPYDDNAPNGPLLPAPPTPGPVVEREQIDELGVLVWTLSNGVRLYLKPTDFKSDEVLFSAFSPGGNSLSPLETFIPASSAANAMEASGVGDLSQVQLEKALAGRVVSVSPYIQELSEGLQGSCSPDDLETFFQLVYLWFTAPRSDPEAFSAYRDRTRASLINRLADPGAVFADRVTEVMSQDNPRRRPWKPETVDAMDLETSLQIYRERFADGNDFEFVLVGRFDPAAIEPLVATYLGGLPVLEGSETWVDHDIDPPDGAIQVDVEKGLDPKSRVQLVWHGPLEWTFAHRFTINAMLDALNIHLRERVREELGGTYSITAYSDLDHYPESRYQIVIVFGCAPDQTTALIAAVEKEIAKLRTEPLDEKTLTKVKETMARQREINLKKNSFWQYVLRFYAWHREDPRTVLDFDRYVHQLTAEDIRDAAERYFATENRAVFRLLPEGWKAKEGEAMRTSNIER
jgi:zinc protease